MDKRTEQRTTIAKRLWEQIVNLLGWVKNQVQNNPLPSILVIILLLLLVWITCKTCKLGNLGFGDKTYWDWMELLIIPVVLAGGALVLNVSQRKNELKIAEDNRKEDRAIANERRNQATLEAYFDRMVELLLEHDLMDSKSEIEMLPIIARTRTLAVLRSLDGKRKGHVVQFLYESGLIGIGPEQVVLSLSRANLRGANLSGVNLREANLRGADLNGANLRGAMLSGADLKWANLNEADLSRAHLNGANLSRAKLVGAMLIMADLNGANLSGADLRGAKLVGAMLIMADLGGANLSGADLRGADLRGAILIGATVANEQLAQAASLKGATLPDGTKHE